MPVFKRELEKLDEVLEEANTPREMPHLNLILDWRKDEGEELEIKSVESE
jgi:hypothetical protein